MNESRTEMFALIDALPASKMPDFCNSNCVYVNMMDLKKVMEEGKKITNNYDEIMKKQQWSKKKWAMIKLKLKIMGLQKYCFMESDEVQSMCAAPNMNVFEMFGQFVFMRIC